jgi:hypothetical protein
MKTVIEMLNKATPLPQGFHIRIENAPYMPLVIEGIGQGPRGHRAISVAHYYSQNGDAMRDPEMCFEVETDQAEQIVEIYPYYFLNDGLHVEETGVESTGKDLEGNPTFITYAAKLKEQVEFAVEWDTNLNAQGFPEAFAKLLPEPSQLLS